jgi:RNA polymerase sigma-70 factor (ECF subfamily)
MNDSDLTTRIATGDKGALREAYDLCGRDMLLFARALTNGNLPDAEDCLQECFIRVWEGRRHLAEVRNIRAYLFTTLRNVFLNHQRAEAREMRRRADRAEMPGLVLAGPADERIEPARLDKALTALPLEQRQVVILKVWGGLTLAEIAGVLDEPENTVASRYRYGLDKLRRLLGDAS